MIDNIKDLQKESQKLYIKSLNNIDKNSDYTDLAYQVVQNATPEMIESAAVINDYVDKLVGDISPIPAARIFQLVDASYKVIKTLCNDESLYFNVKVIANIAGRISREISQHSVFKPALNDDVNYIDNGIEYNNYVSNTESFIKDIKDSEPFSDKWCHLCVRYINHLLAVQDISDLDV